MNTKPKKEENIEEVPKQIEEWKGKYLRALADYQNLERRVLEQRVEIMSKEERMKKYLKILNDLSRAVRLADESNIHPSWLEGVKLSVKEFKKDLEREGLEITPQEDDYDPLKHHAIGTKEGPENKIMDVIEMGGVLNGKVIKEAEVLVGQRKSSVTNIPNEES